MSWLGISPQKCSHNPTCQSSLTVILQHRNGEWPLTSHTHGQPHVERLRMEGLVFASATPIPEDPPKCPSFFVSYLEQLWGSLQCLSHQPSREGPRQTGLQLLFVSQLKCVIFLGSQAFPAPLPLYYISIHPLYPLCFFLSSVEQVGIENVRNKTFSVHFLSK